MGYSTQTSPYMDDANLRRREHTYMVHTSKGVLPNSRIYFHTPSPMAQLSYFYPLCIGHFYCNEQYLVKRTTYDSFLIMLVQKGTGNVTTNGISFSVESGDVVFIDCYEPHSYGTKEGWEILWIHITGPMCRQYYEIFCGTNHYKTSFIHKKAFQDFETPFLYLYHCFMRGTPCSEAAMSKYITDLLTALIDPSFDTPPDICTIPAVETALAFIREHFHEPVTVEQIASEVSLSPYYFIRLFKKETSMTPHQYITSLRINSAKFYLKTTSFSVKEITFLCGFQSENSFCITFKKLAGITPSEYRNLEVTL